MDQSLLDEAGISTAREGAVLTVTLNRPERRNAQTPATWRALAHIGADLPTDVAVVILRAEGVSFSAGMDRRMFTPDGIAGEPSLGDIVAARDRGGDIIAEWQAAFTWWRTCDAITIAAVQGHAVGAGFQLALATDLMIVAHDAQLSMREAAYGLVPDLGGTHPLVAAVGYSRALDICLTTRWIGAEEALTSGIAVRNVPPTGLDAAAQELAAALAGLIPGTAPATKHLLAGAAGRSRAEQTVAERQAQMDRLRQLLAAFTA